MPETMPKLEKTDLLEKKSFSLTRSFAGQLSEQDHEWVLDRRTEIYTCKISGKKFPDFDFQVRPMHLSDVNAAFAKKQRDMPRWIYSDLIPERRRYWWFQNGDLQKRLFEVSDIAQQRILQAFSPAMLGRYIGHVTGFYRL